MDPRLLYCLREPLRDRDSELRSRRGAHRRLPWLDAIGKEFHKSDIQIALSITLTLAFRPVGAFIFGLLADRYGRRLPLMIDLMFYSDFHDGVEHEIEHQRQAAAIPVGEESENERAYRTKSERDGDREGDVGVGL